MGETSLYSVPVFLQQFQACAQKATLPRHKVLFVVGLALVIDSRRAVCFLLTVSMRCCWQIHSKAGADPDHHEKGYKMPMHIF